MNKKVMVSGVQPTNDITLGNYLGAIKNFVKYQDEYLMYVFVADLHALTTNNIDINIEKNSYNIAKTYLAAGLDPNKVIIFNQSSVIEHTLLGYIVMCNTTLGELNRMTQFKDKSSKCKSSNGTDYIPTGLLIYPTLMAADILLYQADFVPVGIDQKQHVELTRDLVIRFNHHYQKDVFVLPSPVLPKQGAKITSLSNPLKKMSKSESDKGTIYLLEDVQIARKKIMSAVTDSENEIRYDMENKPGISNLLTILSVLTHQSIDDLQQKYQNVGYGQFKKDVADVVCHELETLQQKVQEIKNGHILESILKQGASKASSIASQTLQQVYEVDKKQLKNLIIKQDSAYQRIIEEKDLKIKQLNSLSTIHIKDTISVKDTVIHQIPVTKDTVVTFVKPIKSITITGDLIIENNKIDLIFKSYKMDLVIRVIDYHEIIYWYNFKKRKEYGYNLIGFRNHYISKVYAEAPGYEDNINVELIKVKK